MIGFLLTFLILFIALCCAFYVGAYASSPDNWDEFVHSILWSWKHERFNVLLCKLVLVVIALVFTCVFHAQFIRDILLS